MSIDQIESQFYQEKKITLKDAIDKINNKKWESIDYNFLVNMYNDNEFQPIVLQQIEDIKKDIWDIMSVRDNFSERMVMKAIQDYDNIKKDNDDTRIANKVINKNQLINVILSWPYIFNPLLQANPTLYPQKSYPLIFTVTKKFKQINKQYIEIEYYKSSRHIKWYKIPRKYEKAISITRDMIEDIDLRQYPFYIRRLIQNAQRTELAI